MVIPWYLWALLGSLGVTYNEYQARVGEHPTYLGALFGSWLIPSMVLVQAGIFYGYRGAPSLMLAWAVWTLLGTAQRIASAQWMLGEPPSAAVLGGVALMLGGAFLIKVGQS